MAKKEEVTINFPKSFYLVSADLSLTRPGFALFEVKDKPKLLKLMSVDNKKKKKSHGQILDEIMKAFTDEFLSDASEILPLYFVREKEILHMKVPSERSVTKTVGIMDCIRDIKNET